MNINANIIALNQNDLITSVTPCFYSNDSLPKSNTLRSSLYMLTSRNNLHILHPKEQACNERNCNDLIMSDKLYSIQKLSDNLTTITCCTDMSSQYNSKLYSLYSFNITKQMTSSILHCLIQ